MKHNLVAPSVGESITEVSILKWAVPNGTVVKVGQLLLEIESDKATVEIIAENAGALEILKQAGDRVKIGELVATIDDAVTAGANTPPPLPKISVNTPPPLPAMSANSTLSPAVQKMVTETKVDVSSISGSGKDGRLTKGDVIDHLGLSGGSAPRPAQAPSVPPPTPATPSRDAPGDRRVPLSRLRQRIAERLVQAQHTAAILTTFNEVDMTAVNEIRTQYKDTFKNKHGVPLSFMSFFTKGCVMALKQLPGVNASIDGTDIVYHDYYDVGIAVGTDRGLVVPVIRNAGEMTFLDIEKKMAELAVKARDGKLSIAEMTGGTFTISNGGTYGSLMSTPILNPPQSAILGMHKIQDRPMAVNGQVLIRPMMYLALSYDHRLIDGKEAVTFLVTLKKCLEEPKLLGTDYANGL
jgi:2-oxoglutarate dehydrogenase E2 component (dihydrolipoamide succinyltransferase)